MFIQLYCLKSMTLSKKQKFHASSNQMIDCLSLLHHYPFHWKRSFGAYEGKLITIACVQTSPLPQKKIGRRNVSSPDFFSEGGKTSVHRLRLLMKKKKSHVKHVKISFSASYLFVKSLHDLKVSINKDVF